MSSNQALGFGFGSVGSVAIDVEYHVDCDISDGGIRMCGNVFQELGEGKCCGLCNFCLYYGKGAEGDDHGAVDGTSVVQEGANNFLHPCYSVAVERGTGVVHGGNLDGCTILYLGVLVRRVF